ncbi:MAG: hypothetical protein ACRCVX_08710 [Shewanella sp.]
MSGKLTGAVAQTSIDAGLNNDLSGQKNDQIKRVVSHMQDSGDPLAARELAAALGVPVSTIHARLNDAMWGLYLGGRFVRVVVDGTKNINGRNYQTHSLCYKQFSVAELQECADRCEKKIRRYASMKQDVLMLITSISNPQIFSV